MLFHYICASKRFFASVNLHVLGQIPFAPRGIATAGVAARDKRLLSTTRYYDDFIPRMLTLVDPSLVVVVVVSVVSNVAIWRRHPLTLASFFL